MSVLIKGMEMPTSCESCPCKTADAFGGLGCQATGYIPLRKANQDRPENCPLVPVPDHGRRVVYRGDVYNAIEEKRIKTLDRVLNDRYIDGMHDGLKQALFALATVEDAPTIIPAEEGEA